MLQIILTLTVLSLVRRNSFFQPPCCYCSSSIQRYRLISNQERSPPAVCLGVQCLSFASQQLGRKSVYFPHFVRRQQGRPRFKVELQTLQSSSLRMGIKSAETFPAHWLHHYKTLFRAHSLDWCVEKNWEGSGGHRCLPIEGQCPAIFQERLKWTINILSRLRAFDLWV